MARYTIGEVLTTIQFKTNNKKEGSHFGIYTTGKPHMLKVDENVQFEIIQLTVTEHHKVPSEWDTENKLDCDGFKLVDSKNLIWHNQYPRASYGQISDSSDREFNRRDQLEEEEKQNLLLPQYPHCTCLVTDFLKSLKEGFDCDDEPIRTARVNLFLQIEQKLLSDFNLVLKEEPVFPDEPKCKDITHFVLIKKD